MTLAPAPEPGEWLRLELEVTGKDTGFEATFVVWVAHHPCNFTQDDVVNIRDATVFAENGSGVGFLRRPWKNSRLPIKPE